MMNLTNYLCIEAGDFVQADEVVAVIETDKVNVDIRSTHSGVIKKYYANEGDTVQVDANFFEIDTDGKGGAPAQPAPAQKEAPAAAPKKVPKILLLIINSGGA
jgi:pyruvate/2-oxoglutarate dehydrogenase complex dihydrolipoamide acyltransferase (E2) component